MSEARESAPVCICCGKSEFKDVARTLFGIDLGTSSECTHCGAPNPATATMTELTRFQDEYRLRQLQRNRDSWLRMN